MNDLRSRDPLNGFRAPRAPEALRQRVLSAAAEALSAESVPGVWARLWASRPLRAAWAVTTLGPLLAHAALSVAPGSTPPRQLAGSRDGAEELRELLALPNVEISPRAERMSMIEPEKPKEHGVKS